MSKYTYIQYAGGEEKWIPKLLSEVDGLDPQPMFSTILSVDSILTDNMTKEALYAIRYSGPFYADFDSKDVVSCAEDVELFLSKLQDKGVDLEHIELYASGSKGFHVIVPQQVFMSKVPKAGVQMLPAIYKDIAFTLAVPSLDLRVYTARKGRMFRRKNVERENGLFKVQILPEDLQDMTVERYKEICSEPRRNPHGPIPPTPTVAYDFLAIYDEAQAKVTKAAQKIKKQKPITMPESMPSFDAVLRGEGIKPDTGFQELSMQIAITAAARGMTEQQLIEASAGLCEKHQSDGNRYNTPEKRKAELTRMLAYMEDNVCYSFSGKALESMLTHKAPDLHGISLSQEDYVAMIESGGADNLSEEQTDENGKEFSYANVVMARSGIYALTEEGNKKLSAMSFENVCELVSAESGTVSALEADIYVAGKKQGRYNLELSNLDSVHSLNALAMRHGQAFIGSEVAAKGSFLQVMQSARTGKRKMHILNREGVDLISLNQHEDPELRKPFLVWADNRGVACPDWVREKGVQFKFAGDPDPKGTMQTDLSNAPDLMTWLEEFTVVDTSKIVDNKRVHDSKTVSNKDLLEEFIYNLLNLQSPEIVGRMLGWTTVCNYRMLLNARYGKFPILHIAGAAGQGKCLGKDTPVRLLDGSIKLVQDIVVGDKLLGPDGGVRNILSTCSGVEQMYKVIPQNPENADSYIVNASHILSFMTPDGVVRNMVAEEACRFNVGCGILRGWKVPKVLQGDLTATRHKVLIVPLEVGDYYGFTIDGDHLFMLGDFTVTHNTEMTKLFCSMYTYEAEPVMLSPQSTVFAAVQCATGSASIPLILDEFKPEAMNHENYGRFKLFLRDCYNNRELARGGGNRDNTNFRALTKTKMSAPIVFIAENMETEPALMERVVFITMVKPTSNILAKYKSHFDAAVKFRYILGILGKYMAADVVKNATVKSVERDFMNTLDGAEANLLGKPLEATILGGPSTSRVEAKERTVFNYAAVKFGLNKFQQLINGIFGDKFDEAFNEMQNPMYKSMLQLMDHTTPEWIKVFNTMQDMAAQDPISSSYIKKGTDYAHIMYAGHECLEIYARSIYHKYRYYVAKAQMKPLFTHEDSFIHGLESSVPCVAMNTCQELKTPGGSHIFRIDQLLTQGFKNFGAE